MNPFPWQSHCAAPESRAVRPFSEAVDDGGEETDETNATDRLVFTRIRADATEPIFIVSEIVRYRETEVSRATTEKLSSELPFRLPLFHTRPSEHNQPVRLSDRDATIVAFRFAKEGPLRATFAEQKASSTHHRTGSLPGSSPPLHDDDLEVQKTAEPPSGEQPQDADRASPSSASSTLTNLLSAAQQYLQALRECSSPPRDLREAWDSFYAACDPLVRRTVAACGIDGADADDAAQESWAEISAKLTRFEYDPNRGSFEAWLRIVVHRTACRRDQRQTAGRIDTDLTALTCPRILGPATAAQREELRTSVREALDAFRPRVSSTAFRILILTTVQGKTSTEIGKRMGMSPGNVRVTRHRTAEKFRQFVAARPALADTFGVSTPPNAFGETRKNQRPDEFSEYSENSPDPL